MGQKIYVVKRAEGEYEDYYEYIEKAFYEQDKADKYITDKVAIYKRLESYRSEWEIIEAELEKAVPEDYYEYIENFSDESPEFPEYWSDSKVTFINAVKETLPEMYERHGEIHLQEMYEYFEEGPYKWNGQPHFFIYETEIE
jgi:hypothetical protein